MSLKYPEIRVTFNEGKRPVIVDRLRMVLDSLYRFTSIAFVPSVITIEDHIFRSSYCKISSVYYPRNVSIMFSRLGSDQLVPQNFKKDLIPLSYFCVIEMVRMFAHQRPNELLSAYNSTHTKPARLGIIQRYFAYHVIKDVNKISVPYFHFDDIDIPFR